LNKHLRTGMADRLCAGKPSR